MFIKKIMSSLLYKFCHSNTAAQHLAYIPKIGGSNPAFCTKREKMTKSCLNCYIICAIVAQRHNTWLIVLKLGVQIPLLHWEIDNSKIILIWEVHAQNNAFIAT